MKEDLIAFLDTYLGELEHEATQPAPYESRVWLTQRYGWVLSLKLQAERGTKLIREDTVHAVPDHPEQAVIQHVAHRHNVHSSQVHLQKVGQVLNEIRYHVRIFEERS